MKTPMPKAKSACLEAAGLIERYGIKGQNRVLDDALAARLRAEDRERKAMEWIPVSRRLPKCDKRRDSYGVPVLVWPPPDSGTAYFGTRITRVPSFYLYGEVLDGITHWMPLPQGPSIERRRARK